MPTNTIRDIRALLNQPEGRLSLEDQAGAGSGLSRNQRPIYIHVGPKPPGTPGRGEPDGYNLQEKTCMNNVDYTLVYDDAKIVLERTHGIDTSRAITQQSPRAVDLAVQTLVSIHPEMEAFAQHGYWAPRAFLQLVLWNKLCKANT
ncbi:hypothetical protein FRC08_000796 [Ceratobasidium sp. 394]|nr:hypothetical protein FRC08_000796 [Ceratobasidium sp. 394]